MSKTQTPRKPKPLYRTKPPKKSRGDFVRGEPISSAHFELRENGTIAVERREEKRAPTLEFRDDARGLWIYHGNSLELLDAIAAKYPEGRFDCIFADPPYFLSNAAYLYNNASAGSASIEKMKQLAIAGVGLNSFISTVVKKGYASKLR